MKDVMDVDFESIEKRIISFYEDNQDFDFHKTRAALHFKIPVDQVTDKQRELGKMLNHKDMYSCTGRINVDA